MPTSNTSYYGPNSAPTRHDTSGSSLTVGSVVLDAGATVYNTGSGTAGIQFLAAFGTSNLVIGDTKYWVFDAVPSSAIVPAYLVMPFSGKFTAMSLYLYDMTPDVGGGYSQLKLYKNNVATALFVNSSAATRPNHFQGISSTNVTFVAGDYFDLRLTAQNMGAGNWINDTEHSGYAVLRLERT